MTVETHAEGSDVTMPDQAATRSTEAHPSTPRTRRVVLAAGVGSLVAAIAARLRFPDRTSAAAGDPLVLGAANMAGSANTSMTTSSSGTALQVTQNGTGTALRGAANGPGSIAGFFTAPTGTGISGVTARNTSYGVYGANDAATFGGGAAVRAAGQQNHGLVATASDAQAVGVQAAHAGSGTAIRATATTGVAMEAVGQTGLTAEATGSSAVGVSGVASGIGSTIGVRGESASSSGIGVRGVSTALTGNCAGAAVTAASTSGLGLFATASATTGSTYGVFAGTSSTTQLSAGVWGQSEAATGGGVGVYGETSSVDDSAGVLGWAMASTGTAAGVNGIASSPNGIGVFGLGGPSPSIGVLGQGTGSGFGVYSFGNAKVEGDLVVTGSISKGGGGFKIDHPLDPATKFLSHSFVESPDMKTIYDGVVTLDEDGAGTVDLPPWFEALNRDLRYQLTPIGAYAPVYVRSKVKAGRFVIAGGAAGQEVSWQVTGIRKDVWADAHRIPVEERKVGPVKGRYLHPVEHGKSAATGIRPPAAVERPRPTAPERPTRPF